MLPSPVVGLLLASPEIGMCHVPWSSQSWAGREDSHYTAATEMWAMAQWHMKEKPEMPGSTGTIKIWLVVSNMIFIFHNIWDVILPMTFIFFKMVKTTNQIRMMSGNHVVLDLSFPSPIWSQLTLTDFWVESAISHLPAVFECLDGLQVYPVKNSKRTLPHHQQTCEDDHDDPAEKWWRNG